MNRPVSCFHSLIHTPNRPSARLGSGMQPPLLLSVGDREFSTSPLLPLP